MAKIAKLGGVSKVGGVGSLPQGRWVTLNDDRRIFIRFGGLGKGKASGGGVAGPSGGASAPAEPKFDPQKAFAPDSAVRAANGGGSKEAQQNYWRLRDEYKQDGSYYNNSLPLDQRRVMDGYIGEGYKQMNGKMRHLGVEKSPPPGSKEEILDTMIRSSPPTTRDTTLYRFQGTDPKIPDGAEFKMSGFTSTSSQPLTQFDAGGGGAAFEVFVKKGSKNVARGMNAAESEYLFTHGARFKLHGKKTLKYETVRKGVNTIIEKTTYQIEYLGE